MADLLGNGPSRKFKIFREEYPAVFRFDGKLFKEVKVGEMTFWETILEAEAEPLLAAKENSDA